MSLKRSNASLYSVSSTLTTSVKTRGKPNLIGRKFITFRFAGRKIYQATVQSKEKFPWIRLDFPWHELPDVLKRFVVSFLNLPKEHSLFLTSKAALSWSPLNVYTKLESPCVLLAPKKRFGSSCRFTCRLGFVLSTASIASDTSDFSDSMATESLRPKKSTNHRSFLCSWDHPGIITEFICEKENSFYFFLQNYLKPKLSFISRVCLHVPIDIGHFHPLWHLVATNGHRLRSLHLRIRLTCNVIRLTNKNKKLVCRSNPSPQCKTTVLFKTSPQFAMRHKEFFNFLCYLKLNCSSLTIGFSNLSLERIVENFGDSIVKAIEQKIILPSIFVSVSDDQTVKSFHCLHQLSKEKSATLLEWIFKVKPQLISAEFFCCQQQNRSTLMALAQSGNIKEAKKEKKETTTTTTTTTTTMDFCSRATLDVVRFLHDFCAFGETDQKMRQTVENKSLTFSKDGDVVLAKLHFLPVLKQKLPDSLSAFMQESSIFDQLLENGKKAIHCLALRSSNPDFFPHLEDMEKKRLATVFQSKSKNLLSTCFVLPLWEESFWYHSFHFFGPNYSVYILNRSLDRSFIVCWWTQDP